MLMFNGYVIGNDRLYSDKSQRARDVKTVRRNHVLVFRKNCKSRGRAYHWATLI